MLLVFGGLSGVGKSTISKGVARAISAVYLRVDTIENSLFGHGLSEVGARGYEIAYEVASDNLALGLTVIADSVNPVMATRNAWCEVAKLSGVQLIEIEIVCSNESEHRHRVETRVGDLVDLRLPTWVDVLNREYDPWDRGRFVIDTAGCTSEQSIQRTLSVFHKSITRQPVT
ncbi:MAG: AAA family ATPase [Granulosicoccus sp.]|nr:AAA family ATPase [Granulosicoccus sp.]